MCVLCVCVFMGDLCGGLLVHACVFVGVFMSWSGVLEHEVQENGVLEHGNMHGITNLVAMLLVTIATAYTLSSSIQGVFFCSLENIL